MPGPLNTPIDRERFEMRAPCPACSTMLGGIVEKNGQDTVRCLGCGRHCYNAPRTETGRAVRSATTVHNAVKPKLRARVLERDNYRCLLCGATERLHIGHLLSVDVGLRLGYDEKLLNDEENLVAMCEECNLGQGARPISPRIAYAILHARVAWHATDEGQRWSFAQDIEG